MNVKELKAMLNKYPDDMEVVNTRCSDYEIISKEDWSVVKAVIQDWGVMRSHPTMRQENKAKEKEYLRLAGN